MPSAKPTEQVDDLPSGEVRPQTHLPRHVGEPTVQGGGVAPRVTLEEADLPVVGAEESEQYPDRG